MSIHVESASIDNPFSFQIIRLQGESVVSFPKNRSFTSVVDQDDRLLAGASLRSHKMGFDSKAIKFFSVNYGGAVIAHFAGISGPQAPLLTSRNGSSDLAAGQNIGGMKFDFRPERGIMRNENQRICRVKSDTDNINLRGRRHVLMCTNSKRGEKTDQRTMASTLVAPVVVFLFPINSVLLISEIAWFAKGFLHRK